MLYPHPINNPTQFLVVDFNRPEPPISSSDIIVPAYPEVGDVLKSVMMMMMMMKCGMPLQFQ